MSSPSLITSFHAITLALQPHVEAVRSGVTWGDTASVPLNGVHVPHVENIRSSGLFSTHLNVLERLMRGEEVPLAEIANLHSRLLYIEKLLQQAQLADQPNFQNGSSAPDRRLQRMTGPLGASMMPPSLRPERLEAPVAYPTRGENREITVTFVDIVGFSPLGEELSHDEVFPVLNQVLERLEEAVESEGGEVPGNWGDALLAIYGLRRGENHARSAIRAALKMERALDDWNAHIRHPNVRELKIRSGTHTGEAAIGYLGGKSRKVRTAIGRTVNIGARLEPLAVFEISETEKEYGILASESTLRSAGLRLFSTEPAGSKKLKGIAEQVEAHRVIREAPPSLVPRGAEQTSFIGRHEELSILSRAFDESRSENRAKIVVVKADAGEGKSRLGDRFIKNLGQEVTLLIAQGENRENVLPYEAIAAAIGAFAGIESRDDAERARNKVKYIAQLASAGDQDAAKDLDQRLPFLWKLLNIADPNDKRLQELEKNERDFWQQVLQSVELLFLHLASNRPLVLVLEDLHWMDPGSIGVVESLLKKLHNRPFFVLGLSRPNFVQENPTILQVEGLEVISLERLTDDQMRNMVGEILRNASEKQILQLIELSGRNPYLITEMASEIKRGMRIEKDERSNTWQFTSSARGMNKTVPLPSGAFGFLQTKIDLLEPEQQEILRLAAVIGAEFSVKDLVGLVGEVLENDTEGQLLSETVGQGLIQNPTVVLDKLVEAKVLLPVEQEPGVYQFPHALLRETAYEQTWKGSREAIHRAMADYLISARPSDLAIIASHMANGVNHKKAAEYYYLAAESSRRRAIEDAVQFYEKAINYGDNAGKFRFLKGAFEALYERGRLDDLDDIIRRQMELAPSLSATDQAGTYLRYGRKLLRTEKYSEAAVTLQKAVSILDSISEKSSEDVKVKTGALAELAYIHALMGEFEEAARDFLNTYELAISSNDSFMIGRALWGTSFTANKLGNFQNQKERHEQAYEIFRKRGDIIRQIGYLVDWAKTHIQLGNYEKAHDILRNAEARAEEIGKQGQLVGHAYAVLGQIFALQGKFDEAITILKGCVHRDPNHIGILETLAHLSTAYLFVNVKEAQMRAAELLRLAESKGNREFIAVANLIFAKIYLKEREFDKALAHSQLAIQELSDKRVSAEFDLDILSIHATILMHLGKTEEPLACLEQAKGLLSRRAKTIDENDTGSLENYLSRVAVNRDINKKWQILKALQETHPKDREILRSDLDQLDFYPAWSLPQEIEPFIRTAIELPGQIVRNDDHEITRRDGRHEPAAVAAVLVAQPLASVVACLINQGVHLDENPGKFAGYDFLGKDISFIMVKGNDLENYGISDWKTTSPLRKGRLAVMVGRLGEMREILLADIYDREGTVAIELKRAPQDNVVAKDGRMFDLSGKKRPEEGDFGSLKFTFVPTLNDETVMTLEMGKGIFTQNPWNFLEAFLKTLKKVTG